MGGWLPEILVVYINNGYFFGLKKINKMNLRMLTMVKQAIFLQFKFGKSVLLKRNGYVEQMLNLTCTLDYNILWIFAAKDGT